METTNGGDAHAIAAHVEAIESLLAEIKTTQGLIRARYDQAASEGIEKDALKAIIKERQADFEKAAKIRVAVDRIRRSLGGLEGTALGNWANAVAAAQNTARKRGAPRAIENGEITK